MGRLIAIMGNSGVGKTTLARQLCCRGEFASGLEQHEERPYQRRFAQADGADQPRYALANQVDYMLLRAEQELAIREGALDGIMDGGLEMDFYVFTRLFHQKGYLDQAAFELCERMYRTLRRTLPVPEVMIYLAAPVELIAQRFALRQALRERAVEVARLADLKSIQGLLEEWRHGWTASPILMVDADVDDPGFVQTSQRICQEMQAVFFENLERSNHTN